MNRRYRGGREFSPLLKLRRVVFKPSLGERTARRFRCSGGQRPRLQKRKRARRSRRGLVRLYGEFPPADVVPAIEFVPDIVNGADIAESQRFMQSNARGIGQSDHRVGVVISLLL